MKYDEFIGQVQYRAELGLRGEALRATRTTLTTLGERLHPGEADDLASPLPMEIDRFVADADSGQSFDYSEFTDWVAERARVDEAEAGSTRRLSWTSSTTRSRTANSTTSRPGSLASSTSLFERTETGSYYE